MFPRDCVCGNLCKAVRLCATMRARHQLMSLPPAPDLPPHLSLSYFFSLQEPDPLALLCNDMFSMVEQQGQIIGSVLKETQRGGSWHDLCIKSGYSKYLYFFQSTFAPPQLTTCGHTTTSWAFACTHTHTCAHSFTQLQL